jgi:hypothetical protein
MKSAEPRRGPGRPPKSYSQRAIELRDAIAKATSVDQLGKVCRKASVPLEVTVCKRGFRITFGGYESRGSSWRSALAKSVNAYVKATEGQE